MFTFLLQIPLGLRDAADNGEIAPIRNFSPTVENSLKLVLIIATFGTFFYMLWGALAWITAAGDSGKIAEARKKITQSVIGLTLLACTGAIFLILQYFLGINILFSSGSGGSGGGGGGGAQTCNGYAIGTVRTESAGYEYCSQGGVVLRCNGPDEHLNYAHFDPCSCTLGSQYQNPGYDFDSC